MPGGTPHRTKLSLSSRPAIFDSLSNQAFKKLAKKISFLFSVFSRLAVSGRRVLYTQLLNIPNLQGGRGAQSTGFGKSNRLMTTNKLSREYFMSMCCIVVKGAMLILFQHARRNDM